MDDNQSLTPKEWGKNQGTRGYSQIQAAKPDTALTANNSLNTYQTISVPDFDISARINRGGTETKDSSQLPSSDDSTAVSDERCKLFRRVYGDTDILDLISSIDAYRFHYKPEATAIDPDIDPSEEHTGVMAQDLRDNPLTEAAVVEDPSGYLKVDTKELTMTTFALVTELAKRVKALEEKLM